MFMALSRYAHENNFVDLMNVHPYCFDIPYDMYSINGTGFFAGPLLKHVGTMTMQWVPQL